MAKVQARVEAALGRFLPSASIAPQRLHDAMRYAVLGGGKRARPLLAFAAGEFAGADPARLDVVACALECIHAYSLVHDDLPCMDNDVLRRGKPTCHVEFDEATALLVGDSLQALAFQLLAEHRLSDDPVVQMEMVKILAVAGGSRGMAGGQAIDLASVGQALSLPELEHMHIHKTGALIRASVRLGALAAGHRDAALLDSLERYGHAVGLAFQIRDDLLDVEAGTEQLGKTAGKDAAAAKPTYPGILGIDASRAELAALTDTALAAVATLDVRAKPLRDLAQFVADRSS